MSEHYPRIRVQTQSGYTQVREGLSLTFYMPPRHPEFAEDVLRALDIYLRYTGPNALGLYADTEGYWQNLSEAGWARTRRKLLEWECPLATLEEANPAGSRYAFHYYGKDAGSLTRFPREPDAMCEATFWLPSEYLEEHGPGRVRELGIELATLLPIRSGFCGLSFNGELDLGTYRQILPYWRRYPGIDVPESSGDSWAIGNRINGTHWMNFIGQPVLGELGGAPGLRERLKSPGTVVQELPGDKAVITLGQWPEAGDTEQGELLPAYRELARVLEPWLYFSGKRVLHQSPEESLRWERRFLD